MKSAVPQQKWKAGFKNYAGFLVQKNFSDEEIDKILSKIPKEKKTSYDKNLIENLTNFCFI